jgi:hypothetical protein
VDASSDDEASVPDDEASGITTAQQPAGHWTYAGLHASSQWLATQTAAPCGSPLHAVAQSPQ